MLILGTNLLQQIFNIDKEHFTSSINAFQIIVLIILFISGLATMISSGIIAYKCNRYENIFIKICIVIFALLLCEFYVPYYLIKYVILKRKCKSNILIKDKRR